jgi:hypothetical protein
MKLVSTEGELWWIMRADDVRPVRGLTTHHIIAKVQEKFQFASLPTMLPSEGKPLVFKEGWYVLDNNPISIKLLEAYSDGVHIKVDSSTDDADFIFSEARAVLLELGAKPVDKPLLKYHVSTIVADFDTNVSKFLKSAELVVKLVSESLELPADVGLRGLFFGADASGPPVLYNSNPSLFRLETRSDTLIHENRYFSVANMTTEKHTRLLAAIDEMNI